MARNTKTQLKEAIKRLMERKPLDGITVQELADEANVNKKTFYYHYHGIADLLVWMYTAEFCRLIDSEGVTAENWRGHLKSLSSAIRGDARYVSMIFDSGYGAEFRQAVSRIFDRAVGKYIKFSMKDWEMKNGRSLALTAQGTAYLVSYHSMALFGVVELWFRRGMKESDEELSELIRVFANGSLHSAFGQMNTIRP